MAVKAYHIPDGTMNLAPLFGVVDLTQLAEYYIELIDNNDYVIATTPKMQVCGCADDEDIIRIFFLNALGAIGDAMNFKKQKIEHEAKSDSFEVKPSYPLNRTEHAINRFNVKSNDIYTLRSIEYREEDQDWIDELFDSPVAFIAWPGGQGLQPGMIPIVITDMKREKFKRDDRFYYEVDIEFKFSHEKFNIRN